MSRDIFTTDIRDSEDIAHYRSSTSRATPHRDALDTEMESPESTFMSSNRVRPQVVLPEHQTVSIPSPNMNMPEPELAAPMSSLGDTAGIRMPEPEVYRGYAGANDVAPGEQLVLESTTSGMKEPEIRYAEKNEWHR